jgi:hypothetical protein
LVRGRCYKEALKLAGKILVLDPDNATVQEFQLVLAEGKTASFRGRSLHSTDEIAGAIEQRRVTQTTPPTSSDDDDDGDDDDDDDDDEADSPAPKKGA